MISATPPDVRNRLRMLYGSFEIWYGRKKNHSGLVLVDNVSSMPPMKKIEPAMNAKYESVSLWRDSSAFSWK